MKEYTLMVGGLPHTFLLSDTDAEARGLVPVPVEPESPKLPEPKARTTANKARSAKNK